MTAATLLHRPTLLYRIYDTGGRLLYVGISANVERRMEGHGDDPWYDAIAAIDIAVYPDRRQAKIAETDAIRAEWPLWNVHQSPWGRIVQVQTWQLRGYGRQDRWGNWHQLRLATRPSGPWAAAEKARFERRARHVRHVHRLLSEALTAAHEPARENLAA